MADIDINMSCTSQVAHAKLLKITDMCRMQNEAIGFLSFESVDIRRFRERPILSGYCYKKLFILQWNVFLRAMDRFVKSAN